MRKGIKILGKVFSAAVLLLIIVPVALSLLLDIPAVQNYAVHRAACFVSRKLETTVSIDRVDIGIFSKVRVKGFYVEDYQRDTLLYVGKLDAFITSFGIFGGDRRCEALPAADARRGDEHQTDRRPHFRPRQTQEGQFPPLAEEGLDREHGPLPRTARPSRSGARHRLLAHAPLRHHGPRGRFHDRRAGHLHLHCGLFGPRTQRLRAEPPGREVLHDAGLSGLRERLDHHAAFERQLSVRLAGGRLVGAIRPFRPTTSPFSPRSCATGMWISPT